MTEPNELKDVIKAINKEYGNDNMSFLEGEHTKPKEILSTGIPSLDLAVGNGGLATGTIVEIFGPESGGKTTLALHMVANAQQMGFGAAYLDMEHSLDPDLAKAYGVGNTSLIFDQPDTGEEALGKAEMLINSGKVKIVVIDSVDALVPRAVLEGDFEDANMGKLAKLMSGACRKLVSLVSDKQAILVFINQIRMKIGVMYGNPETTSGGNALKFYASYRLDVRRKEPIKEKDVVIGAETCVKVKKNKKAPPFRECVFSLLYGKGVDKYTELANVALALGLIDKSGAWFFYGEDQIGQGSKSVVEKLRNDPEFYKTIEEAVKNNKGTV